MCGRARLSSDVSEIKLTFSIPPSRPAPNFAARLERGADRSAAGRAVCCEGWSAKPRCDALGPHPLLGQGHQDRFLDLQRAGRGDRHQARLPRGVPATALSRRSGPVWRNCAANAPRDCARACAAIAKAGTPPAEPSELERISRWPRPYPIPPTVPYASATARRAPIVSAAS
jgi:hypothetical protein